MNEWAIIQICDYWSFKNGINPYHVYETYHEVKEAAKIWFSHVPYEIRQVDSRDVPKKRKTAEDLEP